MEEPRLPPDETLSPEGWRTRVEACFEALRAAEAPITLETLDGVQVEARIESLDGLKGRVVLSVLRAPSAGLEADDEVNLFFTMHEARWVGRARIHYHNDRRSRFTVLLPRRLDPGDRRREARIFLDTSENVKVAFIPDGIRPVHVTGRLSNLSEGGFRFAVEGVQDLEHGHVLDPCDILLEEKQGLASLSVTGLREAPLEAEGIVLEVDPQPLGPVLGVRFKGLRPVDREFLRAYVASRARVAPTLIPVPPPPEPPEETPGPPAPVPGEGLPPQSELRLKRFKTLALVMPPGPGREALRSFLATQGFTRVLPAGTLSELAVLARKAPPNLFLVDWPDPAMPELDIVAFLGRHPFPWPPRLVLACAHATAQLTQEAHRLGVSQVLVKPYALDADLVALLLEQLAGD